MRSATKGTKKHMDSLRPVSHRNLLFPTGFCLCAFFALFARFMANGC